MAVFDVFLALQCNILQSSRILQVVLAAVYVKIDLSTDPARSFDPATVEMHAVGVSRESSNPDSDFDHCSRGIPLGHCKG